MTITAVEFEIKYAMWFFGKRNTKQAMHEILELFSTEPDEKNTWSEQDVYEQSRKIIMKWNEAEAHIDLSVLKFC